MSSTSCAKAIAKLPSDECEAFIGQLGGATNRVGAADTAYPHRDAEFVVNVHTAGARPPMNKKCIAWARGLFDALTPHATGGVYVNFMPEDEAQRVAAGAYGPNFERLSYEDQVRPGEPVLAEPEHTAQGVVSPAWARWGPLPRKSARRALVARRPPCQLRAPAGPFGRAAPVQPSIWLRDAFEEVGRTRHDSGQGFGYGRADCRRRC